MAKHKGVEDEDFFKDIELNLEKAANEKDVSKYIIPNSDDGVITDEPIATGQMIKVKKDGSHEIVHIKEENGYKREVKTGKFVKGNNSPHTVKAINFDKLIKARTGPNADKIVNTLIDIALYNPEKLIEVEDRETGTTKWVRKKFHFYNSNVQMQALTLLMKYFYGNPRKEITIDQNVDIKIEKKVADLTKLINDNRDKLKLVKGQDGNNKFK